MGSGAADKLLENDNNSAPGTTISQSIMVVGFPSATGRGAGESCRGGELSVRYGTDRVKIVEGVGFSSATGRIW